MQEFFDWVLAGFSALLGFLLNSVWQAVKDLQKEDQELAKRVGEIEVLVAGNYVTRQEFDRVIDKLFTKLDHIEMKIDKKADK
jgi:DNA integrity scanning protein DisA with diadenylate cyclase activity